MKINLTVDTEEFLFIKHALKKQLDEITRYMDTMYQVAEHLDNTHNIEKKVPEFEEEPKALVNTLIKTLKRRGRPPAKKRGRSVKAKV